MAWAQPAASPAPANGEWALGTTWYQIKTGNGYYLRSDKTQSGGYLALNSTEATAEDAGLWCFVGNAENGYTFYNKAAGPNKSLNMYNSDANAYAVLEAAANTGAKAAFDFVQSTKTGATYWCLKEHGTNNNYWNRRSERLAFWNAAGAQQGDNGSAFLFTDMTSISDVDEFVNGEFYTVSTANRGGWTVNEGLTKFISTNDAGFGTTTSATEARNHFAVLKSTKGNYYLYSLAAEKFVKADCSLAENIGEPIEFTTFSNNRSRVNFKGYSNKYINLGGSHQMAVDGWSTIDAGNNVRFLEIGEFDYEDVLQTLDVYELLPALDAAIATAESKATWVGDAVGFYSYEGDYAAELDAVKTFRNAIDKNTTVADVEEKINALETMVSSLSFNQPETDKYYTIESKHNGYAKNSRMGFDANSNGLIWNSDNNVSNWFKFVGAGEGKFYLYNVKNGKYLSTANSSANNQQFAHATTTTEAKKITITNMGNSNIVKIVPDGGAMIHAQNGGNVVCWNNDSYEGASAWTIVEVENPGVAYIDNQNYATLADAVAAWQEGKTINLLASTNETIELPLGVTLERNGHTADNVTFATPVAKVGETEYASLAAAIKAASAGATITFVADINEGVTLNKNVTIDGANFKYTGTMSANNALTVTVQNVHFVNGGFSKNNDGTSGTYTIKDCTFDGQGKYAYPVLAKNIGTLNVVNCTVKDYQYGFLYVKKQSTKVSVKNVTVEGCANYAVYLASGVTTATFEELTVKNSNNGILWPSAGARTLKLSGCKFENVKTAINSNGGAYVVTANVQGVNNDFGTAVLSDNVKCVLAEDATLAATTAGLNITTNVEGKEVAYQGGKYSVVVKRDPAGQVAYRADVTDKEDREGIAILLKDPYAKKSLVVKVYNGETLMFTCTRRDTDDEGKVMFPVTANTTANIVLWGKESGSWINDIHVTPTELNIPNRVEIWADDVLVQNYEHESGTILGTNLEKYLALDCVKKFDAKIGNTGYETLAAAIEAAQAGETIVLLRDVTASDIITINKAITLDGNGKKLTSTAARAINIETEDKVVINNLTVKAAERAFNIINKPATVELNDVTATASNNAVMIATSAGAANVTINGCDFTGLAVVNVAGADAQVAINDTKITNVDANEAENYGAITVYSTATDAKVTVNGGSINVADDSKKAYIFAEGATVTGVDQIGQIVAVIGDAGYETLTEAIADAKEGQTVKMVYNVTLSEILVINKAITLDGNGKTLTSTAARAINIETEDKVVINNLTVKAAERAFNIINKPATVELNDVTATASNNAVMIATSAGAANVTINGCDFTGLAVVNVAGADAQVAINDTKITNVDANEAENYGAITVYSTATDAKVTVNGGSINVADDSKKAYIFAEGATVTGVDQIGQIVAVIGDAGYETLTEAIADAKEGQTVKMVYDVNLSEILVINKAITLDGNGKKLTSTATGTNARAINVSGANGVTIKNLTIDAKGERAINVIQNATNVTIDNINATAANYTVNVAASAPNAVVAISNSNLTGLNVVNVAAPGSEVTINGGTITCNDQNANENYAALAMNKDAVGAKIATTGVTFDIKGDSKKASNGAVGGEITINGKTEEVDVIVAYIQYGNYYNSYTSIEAAIAKAKDGETIGLIRDVNLSEILVINKAITLDGNGKKLTSTATGTNARAINVSGADGVTIKNLTIDAKGQRAINVIQNATNVTIDGVTATAANYTVNVAGSAANAVVAIKNSTLNGLCTVNVSAAGAKVTVDNSTVNCNDNNTTVGESYAALSLNKEAVGGSIVATDSEINVTDGSDSMKGRNGAENGTVTINGSTDDVAVMVAAITYAGSDNYHAFATLEAAVEFAQAGQTVTLLRDAKGAGVVINKSITIDFNGKTYTANAGVGSAGTQTLALQILKGNDVTLQNGTLTSEGENIKMLVQNYANLTVNNMKLVDATDAIQYVLSNNSGTVNIVNGSEITANGAVALDACKYANYAAPTVNVAEGVTVDGNVEVSAILNMNGTLKNGAIVINGAEGVVNGAQGLNVTAMDGYKVAYAGGVYTIVEKQYVAQVGEDKYETFAAAVAAAPAGATVALIANATEDATVVLTKNLKIDGAGYTFTGAIEFKKSNGSFTVKNVKFNGAGNRVYALKSQSSTTSLTVEGCTATDYTYGFLYANKAIANVTVTDVTVTDVTYGVHSAYGTNVTLNNFKAENVEYGVMVQNYGTRNVVLNNCSFTGCETPLYVWERNQTNNITFNFEGANEMGKADFCTSRMAVVNAEAVVGTKVCGTLAAAVEAAEAGETVTLLRNAQLDSFVTINKSITLNMGEYNITRDGGTALYVNGDVEVAIDGTGTVTGKQALYVANGLVKVNGGNFRGAYEAVYVQNTGRVEIYGGTFASSETSDFVLNQYDADRANSSITVYGGTFVGFNPAANAAEGNGTNFVATGLMAVDNGDGTFGIAKANVKMGDSYYATLAEAIAAIGAGDVVIELLADATLDYNAREAYGTAETTSVTILGNGKTLTLNQTNSDWSSFGLAAGKVVLDNMIIEKTGHGDTSGAWNKHAIIFSSPVEMNNVTVNNAVAVQAGATLNNVTINEAGEYYGLWINGNGQAVTVNGGAINAATNGGRGIKIADQYIDAPAQVTLTVDGTVFSTAKKAAVLVSSKAGAQITASNVNIENVVADQVNFVWVDEDWSPYFVEVEVTGATKAQEGLENLVAQRSNGASYKTLAEAITAAAAGETITLIGNTEEDVTVSKNLTIEGAGMQYTGVMTLNKVNVTVQNLNFVKGQISKSKNYNGGNVTIVNCDFDGQGMNSYAVNVARTGSVVIENVTAQNYGYGFLQLSHANNKLSIKDVKVVNTNYALKIDYSNGVTIDGLKVENVKVAAIYNSNYGTKTYTITNSDFSGATEAIKMWERNTTVYDTFVFAGGNTLGNATLSTSPYAIYKGVVAEVGTKKYLDLRVAFDAANDGETVKMLDDVTLDTKTLATQNDGYAAIINVAGKAVTLDLNGKNITVDAAAADLAAAKGKMLLTVFHADTNGELTLTDNTADKAGAVVVNVNDATVYSVFASESQYSDKSKNGKLTVNGGNYTTVGKVSNAMFFTDANEVITVNGGNFHCDGATTTSSYPWMFNTYGNNERHVTVNGGTFNVDVNHQHRPFEVYVPETFAVNANADGTWTVVSAVAYITEMLGGTVYESGDLEHKVGYATLAAAVEAAQENETVTLLKDVEGAGVVIDKDLTIDFNDKTYTFTEGVGSTGTESNGLQILKGNDVTLKNGTLNVAAASASKFYTIIQNYADLTVEDMTLDGTNLDKWSLTDGDSYVFSNNSGNIVVQGNTNITANNDGDKAFAFDADKTANVTVKTTGTIAGKVEKADGATIAISSGTFTEEILPEWCAEYYVPVQNAEGKWTVEYRYTDELTIVDDDYTAFVNEREITVGTLTYKRTIPNAGVWQSMYVPFEIPVSMLKELGYDVAYFLDVHFEIADGVIDMSKAPDAHVIKINDGTLNANFPYAIRANATANLNLELVLEDVVLSTSNEEDMNVVESSSTVNRFVFGGTYTRAIPSELTGDNNAICYAVTKKGEFKMMGVDAGLPPFRVYMTIIAKDGAPVKYQGNPAESIAIRVIGEENEDGTTTIYDVNAEEAEEMIFDLSGRRVLETEKGIYIKNGKKVLVK